MTTLTTAFESLSDFLGLGERGVFITSAKVNNDENTITFEVEGLDFEAETISLTYEKDFSGRARGYTVLKEIVKRS